MYFSIALLENLGFRRINFDLFILLKKSKIYFIIYCASIIETASFKTASPKMMAFKFKFTFLSLNIANTVTIELMNAFINIILNS